MPRYHLSATTTGHLQRLVRGAWVHLPAPLRRCLVRMLEPAFLVSVVVIVGDNRGHLLCVRHVFRPAGQAWGLPSGFVASHEQPAPAAQREVREETGWALTAPVLLAARNVRLGRQNRLELVYRANLAGDAQPVRSFETVEHRLCAPTALPPGFLPSNLDLLRQHGFPEADCRH